MISYRNAEKGAPQTGFFTSVINAPFSLALIIYEKQKLFFCIKVFTFIIYDRKSLSILVD